MAMKDSISRRGFLGATAAVATLQGLAPVMPAFAGTLSLKASGYRNSRSEALFNGTVQVAGCDVEFTKSGISDINTNLFSGPQTWDFTEIGLHPFMLAYANDDFRDYTLLPVFLLRQFRHKSIYINADSGITKPEQLKGKRIATPGYASTSLTWIRGILHDEYGVSPKDVEWVFAREDSSVNMSGKASAQEQLLPEGISVERGPEGMDESELLLAGEVDALFHAAVPKAFARGNPKVIRLFEDSRTTEQAYYKKTGIFPIMHAVAVRKSLLESHPELAPAIIQAYTEAKQRAYDQAQGMGWAFDVLPWYSQELEATRRVMGKDFYSYGLQGNEKTLDTLFRYSYEQGLAKRQLSIDELFYQG